MAMGKNKTGIMAAISAAASSSIPQESRERGHRSLPKGTIGSVRAGLGGIQDIETSLIISWGPKDRLDVELTAVNSDAIASSIQELADSISGSGQQVPVLLRPSNDRDGYFEVVYGRRRILACRQLDVPVKALIRTLDDAAALMAKGLENASRVELSYYERVRFAKAILDQGYDRTATMQALAVSKNTLSQLERISRLVPETVGDQIGAAPNSGRPKWTNLASAFEKGLLVEKNVLEVVSRCEPTCTSDGRLDTVLREIAKRGARERSTIESSPIPGVTIRSAKNAVSVSVKKAGDSLAFANWLDIHLDDLIKEYFERFQSENREE